MGRPRRTLKAWLGAAAATIGLCASVFQLVQPLSDGVLASFVNSGIVLVTLVGVLVVVWALGTTGWRRIASATWARVAVVGALVLVVAVPVTVAITTSRSEPADLVTVPLGDGSSDRATLYFGALGPVASELAARGFPTGSAVAGNDGGRCVSTVVVANVSRDFARVTTDDLAPGWTPVEPAVADRPLGPDAAIRQPMTAPPDDARPQSSWTTTATLTASDESIAAISDPFTATLDSRDGDEAVWTVNGSSVGCRLS